MRDGDAQLADADRCTDMRLLRDGADVREVDAQTADADFVLRLDVADRRGVVDAIADAVMQAHVETGERDDRYGGDRREDEPGERKHCDDDAAALLFAPAHPEHDEAGDEDERPTDA